MRDDTNKQKDQRTEAALTPAEQAAGRRLFIWFSRLNGISISCLAENVLILYALKVGLSDAMTGVVAAFMYLAMPFMLFGKMLVARIGAARTVSAAWAARNVFGLFMAASPLVGHFTAPEIGHALLAVSVFCFFVCRSMGVTATPPLVGELATSENRGRFSSLLFLNSALTNMLTMGTVFLVLRVASGVSTFQGILVAGCAAGFTSSFVMSRIPEGAAPRKSAAQPVRQTFRAVASNSAYRRLLLATGAVHGATVLVVPFSMLAMKKGYGVPDDTALLFALIQMIGGIAMSFVCIVLADRTGPRPLLLIFESGLLLVATLWIVAPPEFLWEYALLLFGLTGISAPGANIMLSHYFLMSVREEDRVPVTMFTNIVAGVAAGLIGTVFGGGLLKLYRSFGAEGLPLYKVYFATVCVLLVGLILVIARLKRWQDWHVHQVLGLFFSPRDLRGLYAVSMLENRTGAASDTRQASKLGSIASPVSEAALRQLLDSPKFAVRAEAISALGRITFGQDTANQLINELRHGEFTTAYLAAEVLGKSGYREAVPALRAALNSTDFFLQGKSMVALAKLGDAESAARVREIVRHGSNPRLIIHGAAALAMLGGADDFTTLLEKAAAGTVPPTAQTEILYCLAEMCGCQDAVYEFLKAYEAEPDTAASRLRDAVLPATRPTRSGRTANPRDPTELLQGHPLSRDTAAFIRELEKQQGTSSQRLAALNTFLDDAAPEKLMPKVACTFLILGAALSEPRS